MTRPTKVVAGGQTGVDQAALLAARDCGIEIGGWCPPDRACETGTIPAWFPLQPTPQDRSQLAPQVPHSQRTEWNVRDSDATLILRPSKHRLHDLGSEFTATCAVKMARPVLVCDPSDTESIPTILQFLESLHIHTLNIAGPRESHAQGIGEKAYRQLIRIFGVISGQNQ